MPEPITVNLNMLTPVWTGDANQDPAKRGGRVRETGVLGSLRWWYEAIIHGLGLYACDPSSSLCIYDDKKHSSSICLVCQLFGCTGYSRRFRLVVEGNGDAGALVEVKNRESQRYFDSLKDKKNKHRGWRIPSKVAGPLSLTFIPMRTAGLDSFERAAIYHTLRLIERYGTLGAKTSHGQGVIEVTNWGGLLGQMETEAWIKTARERPVKSETNINPSPDLSNFTGLTITLDHGVTSKTNWWSVIPLNGFNSFSLGTNPAWIPSAPAVRARLRSWLRTNANVPNLKGNLRNERYRLMGTIQKPVGPKGSDIFVTHLYKAGERWSMRIFGFIPRDGNAVDDAIRKLLEDKGRIGSEVQSALGDISVHAEPYPHNILSLLAESRGGQP